MGEAKRKRELRNRLSAAQGSSRQPIQLHMLPPAPEINGRRIRELTGLSIAPDNQQVILQAFRAVSGEHSFHVGFCVGDQHGCSAIGRAVIERLALADPRQTLHLVTIEHQDVAWDIVLRNLRIFKGRALLFAFKNSNVYDAGSAEKYYSSEVRVYNDKGQPLERLTEGQRRAVRAKKSDLSGDAAKQVPYAVPELMLEDTPWIFRLVTPSGKEMRAAIWNGRRNYAHELPEDILKWTGGESIAIVQVDSPVGVARRSSLDLTHKLSIDFDAVIHWARDTETYESVLKSFIRLGLDTAEPPNLSDQWNPQVTFFAANG